MSKALHTAALAVSGTGGDAVFDELVRFLADTLGVDAAMISIFAGEDRTRMRTLATWLDERLLRSFEYEVARSPCAAVVGRQFRYVGKDGRDGFAPETMFHAKGMDSYAAYSLAAPDGEQLGLIAVMDRDPLPERAMVESMLKIFAVRAVAELERTRAAAALRASEASYRAIFEASEDAVFVHDWDSGAILDVNPKACESYGYTIEEFRGLNPGDLGSGKFPYTREEAARLIALAKTGGPVRFEWDRRNPDDSLHWDHVTLKAATIDGQPRVLAFTREITESKRAEQALRASEEQYRAIFNATADALVLRDADFRIVDVNLAYEKFSGYRRDEVIGRANLVANPPRMDAEIKALHRRALAGEPVRIETVRLRKDGSEIEIELRGVPIRHRGEPHVLYIGRDIGEHKRAEAQRQALERQLRQAQKMEALGQLTGGIAHDFNNLLAGIMGYVVLASERLAGTDAKLHGYLEEALGSCRRARDLIQQMLTFSRGQRGTPRELRLADAVADSLKLVRATVPATVGIRTEIPADAPAVMLDPVQLDQVLLNLCINARDAMDGAGTIEVRVARAAGTRAVCSSCRQAYSGDFAELSVRDDGPGVAPELLERIFEPFFSTKEVGRGSGMGLATVHGIVHEHGGHVVAESSPAGTRFRVLLPLLAAGSVLPQVPAMPVTRHRRPLAGRVLIVDDERSVAEFMRELLQGWDIAAVAHTSGEQALEQVARDPSAFDLVITDHTMPGMTGIELARALAALRPELPVVLYSGHVDRVTERESAGAGIRAMLDKPVEPDRLYGVLESFLN
jgi:PAS domain S-box-containing protein